MSQMTHHIWRLYCTLDMSCRHNGRLGTTVALGRECLGTQWCHLNDRSLNQEQAKPTSNNQRRNSPSSWMNCVNHINVWWKSLGKIEKKNKCWGCFALCSFRTRFAWGEKRSSTLKRGAWSRCVIPCLRSLHGIITSLLVFIHKIFIIISCCLFPSAQEWEVMDVILDVSNTYKSGNVKNHTENYKLTV